MPYKNPADSKSNHERWRYRMRIDAVRALGGKCISCGYADERALQFNHKNGDGALDRKKSGYSRLRRDIIAGKRPDIELLCANCNSIDAFEKRLHGRKARTYPARPMSWPGE